MNEDIGDSYVARVRQPEAARGPVKETGAAAEDVDDHKRAHHEQDKRALAVHPLSARHGRSDPPSIIVRDLPCGET